MPHFHKQIIAHAIILSATAVLLSCSPQSTSSVETESSVTQAPEQALLTLNQILSATDLSSALIDAARSNDLESLKSWQQQALEVARQANLPNSQIALLEGESGRRFLLFEGAKRAYEQAFMQAFLTFGNVDAVFNRYPQLATLHKQGKDLVAQRDHVVQQATELLIEQGYKGDATAQAKQQWQAYMQTQKR